MCKLLKKSYILLNDPLFIHSFWLDAHAVPARVALGVTTLLTMSTQTASINSALPPVAYTKAIDVWQVWLLIKYVITYYNIIAQLDISNDKIRPMSH